MKVLIATPIYPPAIGGPATYVQEIVKRLRASHTITVVAYGTDGEEIAGSRLIKIPLTHPLPIRLLYFTWELFKAAKHADVIYVQNAMAAGLPAMVVGKLRRKQVVLKFVGDEAWEAATREGRTTKKLEAFLLMPEKDIRTRLRMFIQGIVLRNVSLVTTPSVYLGEAILIAYQIPKERVQTNYNATELTVPATKVREPFKIVTIARLVPWKGLHGVIRAIAELKKEYPAIQLVIAGDGPLRDELELLTETLSLTGNVSFTGMISKNNVSALLSESSVCVLNSTYEGLPHVLLESFATETPVVATNIPGTNEVVFHEKTGLLVPVDDEAALASAIARIFNEKELSARLAQAAKAHLKELFTWEKHLATLETFFTRDTTR